MSENDDERSSATPDKDSDYFAVIDFLQQKYTVADERPNQDALAMDDDDYIKYTSVPYVNSIQKNDQKLYLAHIAHEFMSATCLLPSKSKSIFNDPSKIRRYQYIGDKDFFYPMWSFRAKYFHGPHIYRFNVEEVGDISEYPYFYETMAKRLYILHYFKHDNLMHAYFTLSEPWIYRMNIALPNNVTLLELSNHLIVRDNNQCPSIKYVAICILRALKYLHESNIVHHDVLIENCFYDLNGNVLLGGFESTDICRRQEGKSEDIWNVGTTLLNYCFYTNQYERRYPDPTCIEGFENLFNKMLRDRNNNVSITPNFTPGDHQIIHNFATEEMYGFLCRVFQGQSRPSAAELLANDEFVRVHDFEQLKSQMTIRCRDLGIKPFNENVPISIAYKTISPSTYQSNFQNPCYQFKNGSVIKVDFTILSQIYDDSFTFNEVICVGDEGSIFKALFNLIEDVENSHFSHPKILHQNGACQWWYPLRSPFKFFFAWDIFRLRAALDAILVDAANCTCDPFGTRARKFPLSHHKKDISRHVLIEIHYTPTDIIKIKP